MTPETTVKPPFSSIALCLSGGGYRAATYALGTIDMLHQLGMLDNVKLFSTVSGGSFTGVSYANSVASGKRYEEFFADFYAFLKETNCVQLALDRLYQTPSPTERDTPSLIRAAADVYNEKLFTPGSRFQPLREQVGAGKRFLELIFNATEFRKGNSFRFRASHNPNVYAGNGDFKVAHAIADEFRLGDIVAASSCFPAAFEPLRFPEDLHWKGGLAKTQHDLMQDIGGHASGYKVKDKDTGEDVCLSLPLMDGGIYDNQGLSNALEANDGKIFDIFLITDTSARQSDMMAYPKPDTKAGWLSINMLFWFAVATFVLSLASFGVLGYYFYLALRAGVKDWVLAAFQYIFPLLLLLALMGILIKIYRLFAANKEVVIAGVKFQLWDKIKDLSLPDFINMVKARITSLGTMSADVFMKRVRQLGFNFATTDPETKKLISFNLIYDLNPTKPDPIWDIFPEIKPTAKMKELSKTAEAVKTTLWFEKGSPDQDVLVACGQVTTCYSFLKYICRKWGDKYKNNPDRMPAPGDPGSEYNEIFKKLMAKWDELKEKYP
jgi:hypothetical protein